MPRGRKGEKRIADVIGATVMVARIVTSEGHQDRKILSALTRRTSCRPRWRRGSLTSCGTWRQSRQNAFSVRPHMLRHACGFKLANDGQDTRALQHYLGHRNIQHTVRYTEPSPQRFRDFWKD